MEVLVRRQSVESIASATSSRSRSRIWTDDIQKTWQQPVIAAETFEDRYKRYYDYFSLTQVQLAAVFSDIVKELDLGCNEHLELQREGHQLFKTRCSLKMLETCVSKMPTGDEKGSAYAIDFCSASIKAVKCKLEGGCRISTLEHRVNLRDVKSPHPKGLMDKKSGALPLFDVLARALSDLADRSKESSSQAKKETDREMQVGFALGFSCDVRHPGTGLILELSKGFETGRDSDDPVEGTDPVTLLDMAFWRNSMSAKCAAVINDSVASLLSCAYEKPRRLPPCTVSFLIGLGLGAAYVEPKWNLYGFHGSVINTELGGFDKRLPVTDVDLEVDFADASNHGKHVFEKMIAGQYLGEVCRRLVVKVWREDAPQLAWVRQSLPTTAAALVVSDDSAELGMVKRLLEGLWEWNTDRATRERLQGLFALVFERSAGLAAAAIAALAKRSGRLQPAMGGVTVAVEGGLHISHSWYSDNVRKFLCQLLGESTAKFIHLYVNNDSAAKGAAILAAQSQA